MTGYKSPPYLDQNLQLDYDYLEARRCLCPAGEKKEGELLCARCWNALDPAERMRLAVIRPGDGLSAAISMAHGQMMRAKKGWRG
jgi:hypothetical protein